MIDIALTIYGAWHRRVFMEKVIHTLLHESNLPSIGPAKFRIYTRSNECGSLLEAKEAISKVMPCEIIPMDLPLGYKTGWLHANDQAEDLVMFLQPDIVWSVGSFAHIGELIKTKRMIYCPQPRGTESFYTQLALSGRELMHIVHEDAHPVNKSEEAGIIGFTKHPEVVLWPIKGGWICRMFAREPLVAPAHTFFNGHNLPQSRVPFEQVHVIESTDKACGVSLCERDKEWDHHRNSTMRLHPERVADMARGHPSSVTLHVASHPTVMKYADIDPAEAEAVIKSSQDFVEEALQHIIRPPMPIPIRKRAFN